MSTAPTTLGQYQIIREIARSNDIVYEAYDPLMNRRVAVKELSMPGGVTSQQQEERISRFKREAQAAGTLNHANIMTVFSFAEDAGRTFMAMEYLDGQTLRNEIDTKGRIPQERAIEIAKAILSGLEHAHSKGVIHRDIKPDNIQILSTGAIKITDFGIARLTFQPNLTMDGQVFGTPSYMSPEQVVGKDIDQRSDIFSVGVVLYEMLMGAKPFAGDSVVSITYAIMNKEPEPLQGFPHALQQVVLKALEKPTSMRYSSAGDMVKALDDALRINNAASIQATPPPPPSINYNVPPPAANPYAGQYGQSQPQAQPLTYQYNPYSSPNAGQAPMPPQNNGGPILTPYGANPYASPQNPQQMPPQQNPFAAQRANPVFYPPPPQLPLLQPETVTFFKKTALAFLVLGTLFALMIVGFQALTEAFTRLNNQRAQKDMIRSLPVGDQSTPLPDQLNRWEDYRKTLPSGSTTEADRAIAVIQEKIGKESMAAGDLVKAEVAFQNAISHDRLNPAYYTDLGDLYARQANQQQDASAKAALFEQSCDAWVNAAQQESDSALHAKYAETAATAAYYFAYNAGITQDREKIKAARQKLEEVRPLAPTNSDLAKQIDALLAQLR